MHPLLFLCTGNYYRSRLAEEIFNFHTTRDNIAACAVSRGLGNQWPNPNNPGPISKKAKQFLLALGIKTSSPDRMPLPCLEEDLNQASQVICLSKREHKAMFKAKFPHYPIENITFWEIGDVGVQGVQEAMTQIYEQTRSLMTSLKKIS
jgi:protein-tyrosine phosphatase